MSQSARLRQQFVVEDTSLRQVVQEILHRPSRQAISLKEIARELTDRYDGMEVERCLIALYEQGLVELTYTSGYGVGLRSIAQRVDSIFLPGISGTRSAE